MCMEVVRAAGPELVPAIPYSISSSQQLYWGGISNPALRIRKPSSKVTLLRSYNLYGGGEAGFQVNSARSNLISSSRPRCLTGMTPLLL